MTQCSDETVEYLSLETKVMFYLFQFVENANQQLTSENTKLYFFYKILVKHSFVNPLEKDR